MFRHAEASRDPVYKDYDRPLTKKGERDAKSVGKYLRKKDLLPDLIVSSAAPRAKQTAEIAAKKSDYNGEINLRKNLYPAGAGGYLKALQKISDDYERVMLVGHNPGQEELLEQLTGRDIDFPKAGLAKLSLPIKHWKDLTTSKKYPFSLLWQPE